MRRGRILQTLSKLSTSRNEDGAEQRREEQIQPSQQQETQQGNQEAPATAVRPTPLGRGGRILSRLASHRASGGSTATPSPVAETEAESAPARPSQEVRRPSASLSQQQGTPPVRSSVSGDPPPVSSSATRPRSDSNSSSSSSSALPSQRRVSRQDSDVQSSSSVLSTQFAPIEQISYKANLPKEASNQGTPCTLSLNYMTFNTKQSSIVEEYHVDFEPNIESIRLRYQILRSQEAQNIIGSVVHWTGTNLYLPIKLPKAETKFTTTHPVTNAEIKVRLVYVKAPPDNELLPFYNSLMHKVMNRLQFVVINRQHYSPVHKIRINELKLEVWPGWITAIQRLDGGIKLSIDASFRVLRLETVRDIMLTVKGRRPTNLKEQLEQELVGTIIMTKYNNKAYRIDGIDVVKRPTHTFMSKRDGTEVSYVDYMRSHWNVEVQDPNQPMIVHRPKPRRGESTSEEVIYLIPELCVTTGLTDEMRANFTIMRSIAQHTKLAPDLREAKLVEFLQQMSTDQRATSVFADWNLSVRPELDVVTGRRLDSETMLFGNNRTFKVPDNADWTRAATSGGVFRTVEIENWVIMFTERDQAVAQEFMQSLREVSRQLSIVFQPPRIIKLPNDAVTTYVNYGKQEVKRSDQMVVLLTPGKGQREDRYSACKRLYSCEMAVPCQFIRCGTIQDPRKLRSVVQKIVIQMLSKVGGQPWAISLPMKSFMIVGVDVYHDSVDRKKSCVGFVASMNATVSSWWSQTFFQSSLEEIGQKLSLSAVTALRKYHEINGFVPTKIIVYRDGVGDGQLDAVLQFEIVQIVNAINFYMRDNHANEPVPLLSYIVVQKRINAKMSLRQQNRIVNPLPGTFLDHTITHPEYNDFYLVSQHVNQGTVSPTKYIVLTEQGNLKLMHHQKLAYKMAHMYYNWCGTIRVPAPCQYAHKLAYLTGQNIRQQVSERLENKLYYL